MARPSLRKVVLFALNLASTILTLFTGLRENPLIVFITGRYDLIRARTNDGSLSYRIVPDDLLEVDKLADLEEVGKSYRFFSAPSRGPDNLGTDFSMCLKLNSMNVSSLNIYYDDFWGKGSRRNQIYTYSISAPKCDVINFHQDWVQTCISKMHGNNTTQCYQYVLDNFDTLKEDMDILKGVPIDFGADGEAFLKCKGRPPVTFDFTADLMLHQSYWAGGSYYVLFLTSDCLAVPSARSADKRWGLYKIERTTPDAKVVGAINNYGWFTVLVTGAYGVVSIVMIMRGVFAAVVQSTEVLYIPSARRYLNERRFFKYVLPSMTLAAMIPSDDVNPIPFKGVLFMASDVWMNHWLYIVLSILDALVNVRMAYIVFQMGTWMLSKKVSMQNFLFMCSAVTRLTWLLCFAHTLIRLFCKTTLRAMKSLKIMKPGLREKLEWFVDASTLFLSYKIYSLLLFALLYLMLITQGSTTFMVRSGPKRGVFGGSPNIVPFWSSEIACDLFVFIPILLFAGHLGSSLVLLTKYKHVPNNAVIRLLQQRYMVVGWDAFVAMEALGINPLEPDLIVDGVATANCSLGGLLQQLYTSGPSGHVNLAGDFIFGDGGFSQEPLLFHYPVKRAVAMGICKSKHSTATTGPSAKYAVVDDKRDKPLDHLASKTVVSLFDRHLRLFTDGRRLLLVDQKEPGKVSRNPTNSLTEYLVQDALSLATILDIKHLLGNHKKLHIA
uniref:Uncharacterized protein n=1 Tax=Globisporangium ultimum (strain ATCC 200006 / CBS 805.95 / DAOM BR144) TaxID=431595 RepID=K3XBC5_GLOUD